MKVGDRVRILVSDYIDRNLGIIVARCTPEDKPYDWVVRLRNIGPDLCFRDRELLPLQITTQAELEDLLTCDV